MRLVPGVLHNALGRQILGSSFRGVAGAHGVTRELPDELVGFLLCLTPDLRQRANPRLDDARDAARREPAGNQSLPFVDRTEERFASREPSGLRPSLDGIADQGSVRAGNFHGDGAMLRTLGRRQSDNQALPFLDVDGAAAVAALEPVKADELRPAQRASPAKAEECRVSAIGRTANQLHPPDRDSA